MLVSAVKLRLQHAVIVKKSLRMLSDCHDSANFYRERAFDFVFEIKIVFFSGGSFPSGA